MCLLAGRGASEIPADAADLDFGITIEKTYKSGGLKWNRCDREGCLLNTYTDSLVDTEIDRCLFE